MLLIERGKQCRLTALQLLKFSFFRHALDERWYSAQTLVVHNKGRSQSESMKLVLLLCALRALVMAYNDKPYYLGITGRPEDLPDRIVCPQIFDHVKFSWTFLPYQWFDVMESLNEPKNIQRMAGNNIKLWLYREFNSYAVFSVKPGRTSGHSAVRFLYAVGPGWQVRVQD